MNLIYKKLNLYKVNPIWKLNLPYSDQVGTRLHHSFNHYHFIKTSAPGSDKHCYLRQTYTWTGNVIWTYLLYWSFDHSICFACIFSFTWPLIFAGPHRLLYLSIQVQSFWFSNWPILIYMYVDEILHIYIIMHIHSTHISRNISEEVCSNEN